MASKGAPKQDGIVNAVTLAISQSKLKGLADRSTLKSVISAQYQDLVKDDSMQLQVLWNLLKDLPGFDKTEAKAPFCMLKSWESDFKLDVVLPKELSSLSSSERSKAAAYCTASESQRAAALFPDAVAVVKPVPGDSPASTSRRPTQGAAMKKGGGSKVKRLVTMLVLSVLFVGGITAYTMLSPDKNAVALSDISSDLPISEATRNGAELNLRLKGDTWFTSGDRAARELALKNTLRSVAAIKIDTVMVYDSTGNFRASAHWFGRPPVIAVRLKN